MKTRIGIFKECKIAYSIINKLDSMYLSQSTALVMIKRSGLEKVKLINYDSIEEFFVSFEKACNELKSAGYMLEEKQKSSYLLKTLPAS